jgi:hemin uptake protein HemP
MQNPAPKNLRRIRSDELLKGDREIIIIHDDKEYRLRLTSLGKLILTR